MEDFILTGELLAKEKKESFLVQATFLWGMVEGFYHEDYFTSIDQEIPD